MSLCAFSWISSYDSVKDNDLSLLAVELRFARYLLLREIEERKESQRKDEDTLQGILKEINQNKRLADGGTDIWCDPIDQKTSKSCFQLSEKSFWESVPTAADYVKRGTLAGKRGGIAKLIQHIVRMSKEDGDRPMLDQQESCQNDLWEMDKDTDDLPTNRNVAEGLTFLSHTAEDLSPQAAEQALSASSSGLYGSPPGHHLLCLLRAIGKCLPVALLQRIQSPQHRWAEDGSQIQITFREAGLKAPLSYLTPADVAALVTELRNQGSISVADGDAGNFYVCHPRCCSVNESSAEPGKWPLFEALKLLCYIFPRDPFWEPHFESTGRLLLPLLVPVITQCMHYDMPNDMKDAVIETLSSASRLKEAPYDILQKATQLLDGRPEYLHAIVAHRRSVLLRLQADFTGSEQIIEKYNRRPMTAAVGNRLHAIWGHLYVSHLENLLQSQQYQRAYEAIHGWEMSDPPSLMELRVIPSKSIALSKIYRCRGQLREAKEVLQSCHEALLANDVARYQVLCGLADTHCDMGEPELANLLLQAEIRELSKRGKLTRAFRRLLVSSLDIKILQGRYEDAISTVNQLRPLFRGVSRKDVTDQLLHVRTLIASARTLHFQSRFAEAIDQWEEAATVVQGYPSFDQDGFTLAICRLSKCLAYIYVGTDDAAWDVLLKAKTALDSTTPDYWMPTVTTMWLPFIQSEVQRLKDCSLSKPTA
ncbi:hypothetical protein CNMCM6106_002347 [Aspergillus hiratsukae]|uniref:Uncharacterized protein n=1 Tax=Aspergillus hiratsukae TaxID=1194566 RepID=A0A8H6UTR9_9EURO|nr:hypothetical protein CNMCM6106_002347 [Aspergillus hiratsukae]